MTYYKFLHIKGILLVTAILISSICISSSKIDSLENLLKEATGETKLSILNKLAYKYRLSNPDSTIDYGFEALNLAESLENIKEKHAALSNIGMGYRYLGKYNEALEYQQKALEAASLMGNEKYVAVEYNRIGIIYKRLGLYSLALEYYLKALNIREKLNDKSGISNMYNNIGNVYRKRGRPGSCTRILF